MAHFNMLTTINNSCDVNTLFRLITIDIWKSEPEKIDGFDLGRQKHCCVWISSNFRTGIPFPTSGELMNLGLWSPSTILYSPTSIFGCEFLRSGRFHSPL